jgi:opacity protein-like surface antigen
MSSRPLPFHLQKALRLKLLFFSTSLLSLCLFSSLCRADGFDVPEGKTLEIRLTKSLASYSSKKGSAVEGVVIAPVRDDTNILIPTGTIVRGEVENVKRVGMGLIHETARLDLDFTEMTLPDGSKLSFSSSVVGVENSRETVDKSGNVKGIRSTGTIGFRVNNAIAGFAMFDPIAYLYVNIASARMLRFSEPEIWFPEGTELNVKLLATVHVPHAFPPPVAGLKKTSAQDEALKAMIRSLPFRTMTKGRNKPSDMTNLVFLGTPGALQRAFAAAGWVESDPLNSISTFLTLRSITEEQRYQNAPMSVLLLDEQAPRFTFSKSLDTFSKRHHVRIWQRPETWNGQQVLTASSTQDIGIYLSRKNKTFIHVIDTNIDNERAKIVNDLIFTGCVDAAERQPRPWIPKDATNGTGETLRTDGAVAVIQLNDCEHPKNVVNLQHTPDLPTTGNKVQRGFREGILVTRNDLYRGNLIYQGVEGTRMAVNYFKHRSEPKAGPDRDSDILADTVAMDPADQVQHQPGKDVRPEPSQPVELPVATERPDPGPSFEITAYGGWLGFGSNLTAVGIYLEPKSSANKPISLLFANDLESNWSVGTSVTLNTWRYFSNEFSFDYQRGKYRLGAEFTGLGDLAPDGYQENTAGILTTQFSYTFVAHLRPRNKRFRPFIAAGPALQLIHLTDAPFKSSGGIFKVGLRNVGLLLAAYNFASTPPLDGGGVFQFGFEYGGGVKYRVTKHFQIRGEYRETLSPQPRFVERSLVINAPADDDEYIFRMEKETAGVPLRIKRASLGFAFVF